MNDFLNTNWFNGGTRVPIDISADQKATPERLLRIVQAETGEWGITAESLLSWWNARNCGRFDLTWLWEVDPQTEADELKVIGFVVGCRPYSDDLACGERPVPESDEVFFIVLALFTDEGDLYERSAS